VAMSGRNIGSPTGRQCGAVSRAGLALSPSMSKSCRRVVDSAGHPSQPLASDWP
jgi:hypothetical protein